MSLQSTLAKEYEHSKESVPQSTVLWLDKLRTQDTMKRRMDAVQEVLREAESWSTLEMEVTRAVHYM